MVRCVPLGTGPVRVITRASSSTSAGGSDATPCDTIVRQRSTGSPPGPRSGISIDPAMSPRLSTRGGTRRAREESFLAAALALGAAEIERFTHGTTVATNALLERKGARTAFVTTAGFEHMLHLRRENPPHLSRLCAPHPEPLVPLERCYGVHERMGPNGVIERLDL